MQTSMSVPAQRPTSVEATLYARTNGVPTIASVTKDFVKGEQNLNAKVIANTILTNVMLCKYLTVQ